MGGNTYFQVPSEQQANNNRLISFPCPERGTASRVSAGVGASSSAGSSRWDHRPPLAPLDDVRHWRTDGVREEELQLTAIARSNEPKSNPDPRCPMVVFFSDPAVEKWPRTRPSLCTPCFSIQGASPPQQCPCL
jgi:hypothetical protein